MGRNAPHQHDRHDQSTAAELDAKETAETKAIQADRSEGGANIKTHVAA